MTIKDRIENGVARMTSRPSDPALVPPMREIAASVLLVMLAVATVPF